MKFQKYRVIGISKFINSVRVQCLEIFRLIGNLGPSMTDVYD